MAERRTPGAQPFHHNPAMPLQRAGAQPWGASGGGGGGLYADAQIHYDQTSISGTSPNLVWNNLGKAGASLNLDAFAGAGGGASITEGTENGLPCVVSAGTASFISTGTHSFPNPSTYFSVFEWGGVLSGHKYIHCGTSWPNHLRYYLSSETASIINGVSNLTNGGIVGGQLDISAYVFETDATSYFFRHGIGAVSGSTGTDVGSGYASAYGVRTGTNFIDGKFCHLSGFEGRLSQDAIDAIVADLVATWIP